jgi:hypothetical protein
MGKYSRFEFKKAGKKGMNPIWRGIGCLLIVIALLLAYGLTVIFVPSIIATGKIPYQLLGHVQFPDWAFKLKVTAEIAGFLSSFNNPWTNIITFFVILLLLTGVASLVYAIIQSVIGPPRYSDQDAPPSRHKAKKYTR